MTEAGNALTKNYSEVEFSFFCNYFLRNSQQPDWLKESSQCVIEAINYGNSQGIRVNQHIKVAESDYNYYNSIYRAQKNVYIDRLPHRSSARRFPYLADILRFNEKLPLFSNAKSRNNYVIYANADICLPKYFFEFLAQQIQLRGATQSSKGYTSFIVNRKDIIGSKASSVGSLSSDLQMHGGYDLFVFNERLLKKLIFGEVAIGTPPIGKIFALNLANLSDKVIIIDDLFITWHRGVDMAWKDSKLESEATRNRLAAYDVVVTLAEKLGLKPFQLQTAGSDKSLLPEKGGSVVNKDFLNLSVLTRFFKKFISPIKSLLK